MSVSEVVLRKRWRNQYGYMTSIYSKGPWEIVVEDHGPRGSVRASARHSGRELIRLTLPGYATPEEGGELMRKIIELLEKSPAIYYLNNVGWE